ncbi:hypothetical protein CR513_37520, partial [Mucuna pruriens]
MIGAGRLEQEANYHSSKSSSSDFPRILVQIHTVTNVSSRLIVGSGIVDIASLAGSKLLLQLLAFCSITLREVVTALCCPNFLFLKLRQQIRANCKEALNFPCVVLTLTFCSNQKCGS